MLRLKIERTPATVKYSMVREMRSALRVIDKSADQK